MWSAEPNQLFKILVQGIPTGYALDVACGEGRNAIWLASVGWQVDALDFSDVGIGKGRQIADARGIAVNWVVDDICRRPIATQAYDLVAVIFLHTDETERDLWLDKVIQAVRPGGHFVFIAHDPGNIQGGTGGPQDPALLVGVEDMTSKLEGFDVVRSEVYRRELADEPGHGGGSTGVALDTLVFARRL